MKRPFLWLLAGLASCCAFCFLFAAFCVAGEDHDPTDPQRPGPLFARPR